MTYSPTGWLAVYTTTDGREVSRPIEHFDEEDVPRVVDTRSGLEPRLIAARTVYERSDSGLKRHYRLEHAPQIITALPAGPGWRVRWDDTADGQAPLILPIAAWLVHQDGTLVPVTGTREADLVPADGGAILSPDDADDAGLTTTETP